MSIDVKRIAELSMLYVSDDELSILQNDMQSIIEMVSDLPLSERYSASPDSGHAILRSDTVSDSQDCSSYILSQMPYVKGNMFFVPKVVDEDSE